MGDGEQFALHGQTMEKYKLLAMTFGIIVAMLGLVF